MAGAFTRSKLCMQFSYTCVNFKVGSECLLKGSYRLYRPVIGLQYAKVCLHVYLMQQLLCLLCKGRVSVQQFRDGVVLRMCRGSTITLGFRQATIPKSRIEFARFLYFLSFQRASHARMFQQSDFFVSEQVASTTLQQSYVRVEGSHVLEALSWSSPTSWKKMASCQQVCYTDR